MINPDALMLVPTPGLSPRKHTDAQPDRVAVVIVGAGPVGLAAANLLGMAGIETLVIERNAGVYEFPRAIALDDEGLRICQSLFQYPQTDRWKGKKRDGLPSFVTQPDTPHSNTTNPNTSSYSAQADEMLAHVRLDVKAHYVTEGRFLARAEPTGRRNGFPLISTFHQPTFERILLRGLERFPCVQVLFQHEMLAFKQDNERVCITVRTPDGSVTEVQCAYLLACDGGKSGIRRALDIVMRPPLLRTVDRVRTVGMGQRWLVVDCEGASEPSDTILFFCNPGRPAVSVPGPGRQRRWEFMLLPGEHEEDLLREETVLKLIRQARRSMPRGYYSGRPMPELRIVRQTIYTFHALVASQFSRGRVFLMGDAAHLMPPFGGQGMNAGLRDAHNLCWKLQLVLQGKAHPSLLASYQVERRPHVEQMVVFSWLLGQIIMPTRRSIAFLRNLFFQAVNSIAPVRGALKEMRVKPQPRYSHGLLLPGKGTASKLAGTLLPQPHVLTRTGERVLLDDVLGDGFALLRLCEDPAVTFQRIEHEIWSRLGVQFVCVQPTGTLECREANNCICIVDSEQQIGAFLGDERDLYVLVRPDRYIMGVFRVGETDAFARALQKTMSFEVFLDLHS
ncbi:MAG: bifunctional 3-(3-hydroxy-phenyl)propionate/3-hydroxycinnamic acid hydroxylase [Chloroflexota bacterium]|nr:bifunctional 3-(3-hydroxy-phenyl)propionate/3-hydroxycinnamic acid hydroxylase [Chloroflexota bacterium]